MAFEKGGGRERKGGTYRLAERKGEEGRKTQTEGGGSGTHWPTVTCWNREPLRHNENKGKMFSNVQSCKYLINIQFIVLNRMTWSPTSVQT